LIDRISVVRLYYLNSENRYVHYRNIELAYSRLKFFYFETNEMQQ